MLKHDQFPSKEFRGDGAKLMRLCYVLDESKIGIQLIRDQVILLNKNFDVLKIDKKVRKALNVALSLPNKR